MSTAYKGPVRVLKRDEEANVKELCKRLHEENGMFSLSWPKVQAALDKAFNAEGGILGGVGPVGDLHGMVYLWLSSNWYTTDPHWEEMFLYVTPEHRKSRNAVELLRFAKWCSDETGFPLLIGIFSNAATLRKEQLYERQLHAENKGRFFLYGKPKVAA